MKLTLKKDSTSVRVGIFALDSSQTDGRGLGGLTHDSSGLTFHYWRQSDGNVDATAVTLAAATRGTFASGGFVPKDVTNLPGVYEIGIPDAALATGADWVIMVIRGATNMAPVTLEIQLVDNLPGEVGTTGINAIADQVWDEAKAGHVGAGSFGEEVQAHALTSEVAAVETDTQDIQSRLPAALVGGRMDSDVGNLQDGTITAAKLASNAITAAKIAANALTAAKIAADALGASQLATDAVNEIRDAILSDSTPFAGANIDAAISSRGTADAGDAMTLTAAERDSVAAALLDLADAIDTGFTIRQTLRIVAGAIAGKSSGDPGNPVFRNLADSKNRVTATVDGDGNRTAVTYDKT